MRFFLFIVLLWSSAIASAARTLEPTANKPRVLISTDIGGTDPDDNQSMAHLLMYNNLFDLEGLVSSPSFGDGSVAEILRMIELYEQDYARLCAHQPGFLSPDSLRTLCKQGRHGTAPLRGYTESTEGSDWIVRCARRLSSRPLWVLVWGGLEDLAQALHDAPDIQDKIRVYWIGGPNKKWSVNSYAYIVANFPDLWFIENNASYRGFITDNKNSDRYHTGYYDACIRGAGALGEDFLGYYNGVVKMGDSPSLFYLMQGDPENPEAESWGGSFEPLVYSSRVIIDDVQPARRDTVPVYSVVEFRLQGPREDIPVDSACLNLHIDGQDWAGYYCGDGQYIVRYAPKAPAVLDYEITSQVENFPAVRGVLEVSSQWPGEERSRDDYRVGKHWYSDRREAYLYQGVWQGAQTVARWRKEILDDWQERLWWLK